MGIKGKIATVEDPGDSKTMIWIRDHLDYPHQDWCLIWPFASTGGATIQVGKLRQNVFRIMCKHRNGPAPTGEHQAAHSCGRRHEGCVNPWHLSWKTNSENQIERYQHSGPVKRAKLTPEQVDEIKALEGRATIGDIAAQFGVSPNNIRSIHAGQLWRNTSTLLQRVLTEDEVRLIRATPWRVKTAAEFAKEFGVSRGIIQNIRDGNTYKWVPEKSEEVA